MLRKGRYKLNTYIGFAPELFDLIADPEEAENLAGDPDFADVIAGLTGALHKMIDPDAVNAQTFADQEALIAHHGGREAALKLGAPGATPPPAT